MAHEDISETMARGLQRLPTAVRAALSVSLASPATCHCVLDLWERSEAGPEGRFLIAPPAVAAVRVHGTTTVEQAAKAMASAGLLRERTPVGESRIWEWLLAEDVPAGVSTPVSPSAYGAMTHEEREAVEALRP